MSDGSDIVKSMESTLANMDALFADLTSKKESAASAAAAPVLSLPVLAGTAPAMAANGLMPINANAALDPVGAALAQGGDKDPLTLALAEIGSGAEDLSGILPVEPIPEDLTYQQAFAAAIRETYAEGYTVRVTGLDGDDDLQPELLQQHFALCGDVRRVMIKVDRTTGQRTGVAYIDFGAPQCAETATALSGSELAGHTLQVVVARKNVQTWGCGGGKNMGKKGCGKSWGKSWGKGKGKGYGSPY